MKPYYQDELTVLFHGDAREVLSDNDLSAEAIVVDPVWPNAVQELQGSEDPLGLLRDVLSLTPESVKRTVVHLGCDSDPRILTAVPERFPFFRVCWLEYVRPHYKGRLLYTGDVGYVFGTPPDSRKGAHVMPGRFIQTDAQKRDPEHPCPRQPQHVSWLLGWYAPTGTVLDPLCGSGTTLVEAKTRGLASIGIEIEERYCERAAFKLEAVKQEVLAL